MKQRFISFGSIVQFRNIIKDIQCAARFDGFDENGEPIYNQVAKMPKLAAVASEKIHGSNASVCYNDQMGFWCQSRKNIITPMNDNAGCAVAAVSQKDIWMDIIQNLALEYGVNLEKYIISVYFEWAGGNIQKKSAVSGLDKRAIIFQHFKVSPLIADDKKPARWIEAKAGSEWVGSREHNIFNIMWFLVHAVVIDFEKPLLSQNYMIRLVEEIIEPNSPMGSLMGKDGNTGEGIVVTLNYKDCLYRFKVKGEKHSKTKVKTLKIVDEAKETAKIEFANYACSAVRLEQSWQSIFGIANGKLEPDIRSMGDFLRAVFQDVAKEETDILFDKGLTTRDVNSKVAQIAKTWFMEQLDKDVIT